MIFVGDVAHPFEEPPDWSCLAELSGGDQACVVNLEGALVDSTDRLSERRLFNHTSILASLRAVRARVACLANNHITDVTGGVQYSRRILAENGMHGVGAGTREEAASPVFLLEGGRNYAFVAFGWATIQCVPANDVRAGVNPLEPRAVLASIQSLRAEHPDAVIVAMFHWNIELERYPQPAHRQLAFAAIDAGADAIIGHHPHCVGGFELYRGCPIAYSLGDWWIPQGVFMNGNLTFPDYTLRQVAFEWEPGRTPVLHWFDYKRGTHELVYDRSEDLVETNEIPHHTPFWGQSMEEYRKWFPRHRVKRKGLPIYSDFGATAGNWTRDVYIRARQSAVTTIRRVIPSGRVSAFEQRG